MISNIVLRLEDADMMYNVSVQKIYYNKINKHIRLKDWQ